MKALALSLALATCLSLMSCAMAALIQYGRIWPLCVILAGAITDILHSLFADPSVLRIVAIGVFNVIIMFAISRSAIGDIDFFVKPLDRMELSLF